MIISKAGTHYIPHEEAVITFKAVMPDLCKFFQSFNTILCVCVSISSIPHTCDCRSGTTMSCGTSTWASMCSCPPTTSTTAPRRSTSLDARTRAPRRGRANCWCRSPRHASSRPSERLSARCCLPASVQTPCSMTASRSPGQTGVCWGWGRGERRMAHHCLASSLLPLLCALPQGLC